MIGDRRVGSAVRGRVIGFVTQAVQFSAHRLHSFSTSIIR